MVKRTVALFGLYMLTPLLVGALGVSVLRGLACAEPGWKWIGGDASPSGWVTVHGPADVNVNGGALDCKIDESDGGEIGHDPERLDNFWRGKTVSERYGNEG